MKLFYKIIILLTVFISINSCVDEHIIEVNDNFNGSIFVSSQPDSVQIFLQGTNTNKITPDSLIELESGVYDVTLRLEDYLDTNFSVQVLSNNTTTKNVILKLREFFGKINLNTLPSNATILINNNPTGKFTPDSLINLRDGEYTVKLSLPNYNDTTITIQLGKDETIERTIQLTKAVPQGEITLTSNPANCLIYLSDSLLTNRTSDTLKNLRAGDYSITLSHNNYYDTTFTIQLAKNQKVEKFVELKELPPNGSLFIQSNPIGAKILLQGISTDRYTPDTLKQLPVDPYLVTLTLQDFRDTSFIANVQENTVSTFSVFMEDTTSEVIPKISYRVEQSGQIIFTFLFNQDIQLDYIYLRIPESTEFQSFPINEQQFPKGFPVEVVYPEKRLGAWRFQIIGEKLGGRKDSFEIIEKFLVE